MIQIRNMVFETNSSSTHSISISPHINNWIQRLPLNDDNKVEVSLGEFGWGYDILSSSLEKLSYLLTMAFETEMCYFNYNNPEKACRKYLTETEGFKILDEAIKVHLECDGIYFDDENIEYDANDTSYDANGYIDHQSCEDYESLKNFLDSNGITAEDFIFDSGYTIIIDNDNH